MRLILCEKNFFVFECRCPCQCRDADTEISKWPNKNIGKIRSSTIFYNRKLNNISKFVRCYLLRVHSCNSVLYITKLLLALIHFLSLNTHFLFASNLIT